MITPCVGMINITKDQKNDSEHSRYFIEYPERVGFIGNPSFPGTIIFVETKPF